MRSYKLKVKGQLRLSMTFLIVAFLLTGCDYYFIPSEVRESLKLAGENKRELLTVINHYKKTDKEKLEAAFYLIANMPGHCFPEGQEVFNPAFDHVKSLIEQTGKTYNNGKIFSQLIDSIRKDNQSGFTVKEDLKAITSEYLIENIDAAFQAYYQIPGNLRIDKTSFQKYILPYRNSNEPPEPGLRKYFLQTYSWVFDRMEEYGSMPAALSDLLDSLDIRWNRAYSYPFLMPLSNIYKIRTGYNCSSTVNLVVYICRSLGIPASNDFVPIWGNSKNPEGHEWIVFHMKDTVYAVDPQTREIMNRLYYHAEIPKVYRRSYTFSNTSPLFPGCIDVTMQYRETSQVSFNNTYGIKKAYLAVFNAQNGWNSINESVKKNGKITFHSVGRNIVYALVGSKGINDKILDSPFFLQEDGVIRDLKPDHSKKINAVITRKLFPYSIRYVNNPQWVSSINGAEIQGSNKPDFSQSDLLVKITNFNTSHPKIINTGNTNKYKYYRLVSPDSSIMHLARFNLMKQNKVIMTDWQVISPLKPFINRNRGINVIDENPLTFFSEKYLRVTYSFKQPVLINEFLVQARNDDNNVKPGCLYELLYWDNGWVSAGMKEATDTLLIYTDLPSNALFWLKNHTEGKEEQLFLLDNKGNQYWPGVSSFHDSWQKFSDLEKLCDARK